jgi:dienelactone hydrolase
MVYLHGGIGTQLNTKGEAAYLMLSPLSDSMPLFLASPSANRFSPWWSECGHERILQTVRYMTLNYPVDPDRIILAGVSDGATGCYAVANKTSTPFAGFIAISGFGGLLPQLGIKLDPSNLARRPIYNINADGDHLYPVDAVNQFLDWCDAQGLDIQRKIYAGEKHGFDYRDREFCTIAAIVRNWRKEHVKTEAAFDAILNSCWPGTQTNLTIEEQP